MSAQIDVLAVMDAAIARADEDAHQYRFDTNKDGAALREARAAVAELIAAARDLRMTAPTYSIEYGRAEELLDAALAKVMTP